MLRDLCLLSCAALLAAACGDEKINCKTTGAIYTGKGCDCPPGKRYEPSDDSCVDEDAGGAVKADGGPKRDVDAGGKDGAVRDGGARDSSVRDSARDTGPTAPSMSGADDGGDIREPDAMTRVPASADSGGSPPQDGADAGAFVDAGKTPVVVVSPVVSTPSSAMMNAQIGERADFNGDGTEDILWTTPDGGASIWYMDGARVAGSNILQDSGAAGWRACGAGDFDGNGTADILWTTGNGGAAIWFSQRQTFNSVTIQNEGAEGWSITGAGDFDNDGRSDILWTNLEGAVSVWMMNGAQSHSSTYLRESQQPSDRFSGTGDFDGNGTDDILWNTRDSVFAIWFMNGPRIERSVQLQAGVPGWWPAGVGDANGDGMADILWTNAEGSAVIWMMRGSEVIRNAVFPERGEPEWTLSGLRNFDRAPNKSADLLWTTPAGGVTIWQTASDGASTAANTVLQTSTEGSWHVVD